MQLGGLKLKDKSKTGFAPVYDMIDHGTLDVLTYESLKGFLFTLDVEQDVSEYLNLRGSRFVEPVTNYILKFSVITDTNDETLNSCNGIEKATESAESYLEEAKLQQEIDLKEEQITQLSNDNTNLKQQVDALNGELGNKGDMQKQHADEIEKLTQQNIQALKEQQEKNDQAIAELKAQIEAKDKQIEELNQSTGAASQQLSQQLKECQDKELEFTAQIESLNQQITQLTQQNQVLTERIKSATEAINLTVSKLNELTDEVADAKNTEDIKKLFQEINDTIDKINMTIKSQSVKTATAVQATTNTQSSVNTSTTLSSNTPITLSNGQSVPLSSIKQQLNMKNDQLKERNPNNKYGLTLEIINKASRPEEVLSALSSNGVQWKNDKIMGGRKSKTYKKNKRGGFTYKKSNRSSYRSKSSSKGGRKRKHNKSKKM